MGGIEGGLRRNPRVMDAGRCSGLFEDAGADRVFYQRAGNECAESAQAQEP